MVNRKRKLVCLNPLYNESALGKDNFMVPYLYGKMNDMDVEIVYPDFELNNLPETYRGVKLKKVRFKTNHNTFSFKGEWWFYLYVIKNARKIDVLMRWCFSYNTWLIGLIYKTINPKGVFFIKGDDYGLFNSLLRKNVGITRFKNKIIEKILQHECHLANIITVDTSDLYSLLKAKTFNFTVGQKLNRIINAFDEEKLQSMNMKIRTFEEKENIIITVGRLGTKQKNTELLLATAELLNLKDWKIFLIGPIEPNFQSHKDSFFLEHPHLKDKVIFTGAIYDKWELWEWYNRSKVFVLTSRHEGYAVVYMEAIRFSNYILTTDVGGARDSLEIGNGDFFEQENSRQLADKLQFVIDEKISLKGIMKNNMVDPYVISWEYELMKLQNKL